MLTETGMVVPKAKIRKRRRVGEALQDTIDVAGVAEIPKSQRRTTLPPFDDTRHPPHLRNGGHSAATAKDGGSPTFLIPRPRQNW